VSSEDGRLEMSKRVLRLEYVILQAIRFDATYLMPFDSLYHWLAVRVQH